MKLKNRRVIITGANQGLGAELAKTFLEEGASVVICARDKKLLKEKATELESVRKQEAKLIAVAADISQENEVQRLVDLAKKELGGVDILIANAAIHGPKGAIEDIAWDEWSKAVDINLKGTVLQCRAVVPLMKQNGYGKIVILSGGGATKPMPYLTAYAASKAAVVRFAESLALELKDYGIDVNSVAPGAMNTRLLDDILNAGPKKVGEASYQQALRQRDEGGSSLALAASLCVYLASSESDGITGRLISAVWDPWIKLKNYHPQLNDSDIYTLRRITPEDRNQEWN